MRVLLRKPSIILRFVLTILLLVSNSFAALPQCIDRENIGSCDDGISFYYGYLCPAYFFAFKGDTSKNWNVGFENIDIRQAPANALKFKSKIDLAIKKFAGNKFFRNLKFSNVEVCYPEKLKFFKDSGAVLATLAHYKSRYTYNYSLEPDSIAGYNISIAVNSSGKIITAFRFPSKQAYKPINTHFTYCQLMEIARKKQKDIDSIGNVSFEYDKKKKKFYWRISQALVNEHEGRNYIREVIIDASDFRKVTAIRSPIYVVY